MNFDINRAHANGVSMKCDSLEDTLLVSFCFVLLYFRDTHLFFFYFVTKFVSKLKATFDLSVSLCWTILYQFRNVHKYIHIFILYYIFFFGVTFHWKQTQNFENSNMKENNVSKTTLWTDIIAHAHFILSVKKV